MTVPARPGLEDDAELLGFISGLGERPAPENDDNVGFDPDWPPQLIAAWRRGRQQAIRERGIVKDVATEQPAAPATEESQPEYAIVEIFGHRKLAGRILEVERFGAKLLRIDVPDKGDFANGFTSQFYGGASLFSVTPTDLATVIKVNKPYEAPRLYRPRAADDDPPDIEGDDA